jgi:hypothetical protein
MKIDAISMTERAIIIQHLALHGKWRAKRMGSTVEIARIQTLTGNVIQYAVTISRHSVVHARAATVADAVTEVNHIIATHAPVPSTGRAAGDPNHTGTPHLVRRRDTAPAEGGSGWLPYKDA